MGKPCYLCYDKQNRLVTRGWRLVTIFFFFLSFSLFFFFFFFFLLSLLSFLSLFLSFMSFISFISFISFSCIWNFWNRVYIHVYMICRQPWILKNHIYMYIIQFIWNLSFHNHTGCCPIRTRKYSSLTFIPWNLRQKWY